MNLILKTDVLKTSGIEYEICGRLAKFSKNGKSIKLVDLPENFSFSADENSIYLVSDIILRKNYEKVFYKKISGTYASLFKGAIIGLNKGYNETLNLIGSGYRSSFENTTRVLSVLAGYTHPLKFTIPVDVKIDLEANGSIIRFSGHNKQELTQTVGIIYNSKKRNVYKGTGICYADRPIRTKQIKKK